ncbi:uncharacterized protein TrAtP1_002554 [Trichoderma atroviride]|nr:hypothetical protein TrAtP1_002554 [Trichoderma atroviride]
MECEKWLKAPNVRQIQQDRIEARHPGTCDWIWSNTTFTNWKALTPTSPFDGLLCVSGPPGCGKSVLASSIVDHMWNNSANALFFAFTGMYASHLKLDSLVRSLLSQLLQECTGEQGIRILQDFMLKGQPTISDLWRAFSMIADTFIAEPIYCVIDGVDESEDLVHELVQKLFGFLQSHSNFRFIVLGRSHAFHATDYVRHTIQIDSTLTKEDVDTVIEAEITQSDVFITPDLRTEVRRTLTDQCEGNLLWIKLMVEHLNKSVGVADAFKRLRGLPRDLQTAYETLLCGLVGRLERSELNLARKVFAFIIVSQCPLSLDELQYLLAADAMSEPTCGEKSIEDHLAPQPDLKILDVCGGLVNFIGDHLRLVHFSVMEFLIRPKSQWSHSRRSRKIQQFRVPLKQAHGWIAAASITYLETCYYSYQTHDWTKSPQLVKHNQLLGYSSKYSATHITQSDIKPGVIAAKIDKFLKSDRCVPWIEHFIMIMIDDESLDSQPMEFEKLSSWLGKAGHSLGLLQRVQTCLNREIDRRSQQYGQDDSRTERIRLFLDVVQNGFSSTGLQAVDPSSVGSVGAPTDISSILQLLRHETPLSLELKANLLLKLQLHLQKVKQLTDPLQIMFRILLEKASGLPIYALLIVGKFYLDIEKFEESLEIYFKALDKLEESEVPLKYFNIYRIGDVYKELKQYDKSMEYYARALAGREKILGPEHKDTLSTLHNISYVYSKLGQHAKAMEYDVRALAGREKILGPKHKDTLSTLHDIGCDYVNLKQYDKAMEYYARALAGREKILGPEHKDTLSTLHNISYAYSELGQHAKAIEYDIRALAGREKILGPKHKDTLSTLHDIGCDYVDLKQYDKAMEYYARALAGREKILGPEHEDTLLTINAINLIWDDLRQHDEALEYFSIFTGEEDEIVGPEYEDTLPTINNIHNSHDSLEQYDIPSDDLVQTLSGQEKEVSKPERRNTKVIQRLLGVICCNFQR